MPELWKVLIILAILTLLCAFPPLLIAVLVGWLVWKLFE